MSALSNAAANMVLGMMFGLTANDFPEDYYIGLSSTEPTNTGTNITEPVGASYDRVVVPNDDTNFTVTAQTVENALAIEFPEAMEAWGDYDFFVLFDVFGVFWGWGVLNTTITVDINDTVTFAPGTLVITAAGA